MFFYDKKFAFFGPICFCVGIVTVCGTMKHYEICRELYALLLVLWRKVFETAKNAHQLKPKSCFLLKAETMLRIFMSLCCHDNNVVHLKT